MRKQKMEETILDNNTQLDLDEQLPVVEISDKFTKDKLIQNKENKEVKSKKDLINCLILMKMHMKNLVTLKEELWKAMEEES